MISLIACSVHRLPGIWRTAMRPRVDVGPGLLRARTAARADRGPRHLGRGARQGQGRPQAPATTGRSSRTTARSTCTRTATGSSTFASLAGHISLILILLGAIIGTTFGYKNSSFTLAEGSTLPIGTESGLTLKLIDFTDTWYTTTANAPEDYASQVVLYKDGTKVAATTIRVNEPLSYDGATYYQAFLARLPS